MKMYRLTLLLTALCSQLLTAEVSPVTLVTGRGDGTPTGIPSSYTVPTDKVLILESVQYQIVGGSLGTPDDLNVQIIETFDNASSVRRSVFFNLGPNRAFQQHSFDSPVRLKAGSSLRSSRIEGFYIWRGLLVDTADLFAQLDVELKNTSVKDGKLMAEAKVSSPRPHKLMIESSTDLDTFAKASNAIVTLTADPSTSEVSVPTDGDTKKFIKATAQVRC